jgi:hypothetical protein
VEAKGLRVRFIEENIANINTEAQRSNVNSVKKIDKFGSSSVFFSL